MDIKKFLPDEKTTRIAVYVIAALAVLYMAAGIYSNRRTKSLDDFKIYYYTAKAFKDGLNPYSGASINREAGFDLKTIYRYAPYSIYIFRPLVEFDYDTACAIYLWLKIILLMGLFYIWQKFFIKEKSGMIFMIFFIAGFHSAVYIDLKVGNISIIEQFLIWTGLYFFTQKKHAAFSAFIIAASMVKFWPILILFAYLAEGGWKNLRRLAASFAVFAFIQAVLYLLMPALYPNFINNSPIGESGGAINPSSFMFIRDFFAGSGASGGITFISAAVYIAWAVFCIAAAVFAVNRNKDNNILGRIYFILLTYALIVPRMKDYSFILLLPVAYYFTIQALKSKFSMLALVLFSVNMICFFSPQLLCGYYYLMAMLVIWVFGLIVLLGDGKAAMTPGKHA